MSSATTRRVAKLEAALLPREAVLAWLSGAQQFPNIVDHARAIADLPVEAAPLSVISARVVGAVGEARKVSPATTSSGPPVGQRATRSSSSVW